MEVWKMKFNTYEKKQKVAGVDPNWSFNTERSLGCNTDNSAEDD
jgi:hypothetical protein